MGVLTVADGPAVALLANALAEYIAAAKEVEASGVTFTVLQTDKEGAAIGYSIKANPATTVRADAWRRVNLMLQQFGLTASSRVKVRVERPQVADPFEELLKRRGKA